ncbi:hypothetical protein KI387_033170, partial [Taxus chinensis]
MVENNQNEMANKIFHNMLYRVTGFPLSIQYIVLVLAYSNNYDPIIHRIKFEISSQLLPFNLHMYSK